MRHKIIRDASDDVLRQNALLTMLSENSTFGSDNSNTNQNRNNISFLRFSKESEKLSYIKDIENEIINIEQINKDSWKDYFKFKNISNTISRNIISSSKNDSNSKNKKNKDSIGLIDDNLVDFNRDFTLQQELENKKYININDDNDLLSFSFFLYFCIYLFLYVL